MTSSLANLEQKMQKRNSSNANLVGVKSKPIHFKDLTSKSVPTSFPIDTRELHEEDRLPPTWFLMLAWVTMFILGSHLLNRSWSALLFLDKTSGKRKSGISLLTQIHTHYHEKIGNEAHWSRQLQNPYLGMAVSVAYAGAICWPRNGIKTRALIILMALGYWSGMYYLKTSQV